MVKWEEFSHLQRLLLHVCFTVAVVVLVFAERKHSHLQDKYPCLTSVRTIGLMLLAFSTARALTTCWLSVVFRILRLSCLPNFMRRIMYHLATLFSFGVVIYLMEAYAVTNIVPDYLEPCGDHFGSNDADHCSHAEEHSAVPFAEKSILGKIIYAIVVPVLGPAYIAYSSGKALLPFAMMTVQFTFASAIKWMASFFQTYAIAPAEFALKWMWGTFVATPAKAFLDGWAFVMTEIGAAMDHIVSAVSATMAAIGVEFTALKREL